MAHYKKENLLKFFVYRKNQGQKVETYYKLSLLPWKVC